MTLAKTGLTETSSENFIIDAGTIFKDVTYSETEGFTGTPLGATTGGVKVTITNTYRKIEVDGAGPMDVKGLNTLVSAQAKATASVKEITAENLRLSLNGAIRDALPTEAPTGYKVVTNKRYLEDKDYIPTVGIVGIHNGTKQPIIFLMDNGLVTSPADLEMKDNAEAAVALEIQANASIAQLQADTFPWRILYPGEADGSGGTGV